MQQWGTTKEGVRALKMGANLLKLLIMFYCRGSRTHRGIDVICNAGSSVYAPFSAKVIRESRPYGNGKPHDTGIYMEGTGDWTGKYFLIFDVNETK